MTPLPLSLPFFSPPLPHPSISSLFSFCGCQLSYSTFLKDYEILYEKKKMDLAPSFPVPLPANHGAIIYQRLVYSAPPLPTQCYYLSVLGLQGCQNREPGTKGRLK